MARFTCGWQTRNPWERFNNNLFHVAVYQWFPFDAHLDLLWTRWRISLGYVTRSIGVTAELHRGMVIVRLDVLVTSIHVSGFWDFFARAPGGETA